MGIKVRKNKKKVVVKKTAAKKTAVKKESAKGAKLDRINPDIRPTRAYVPRDSERANHMAGRPMPRVGGPAKRTPVTFSLDSLARAKKYADDNTTSVAQVVRQALDDYLLGVGY